MNGPDASAIESASRRPSSARTGSVVVSSEVVASASLGRIGEADQQRREDEGHGRGGRLRPNRTTQGWLLDGGTSPEREVDQTERRHEGEGRRLGEERKAVAGPDQIARVRELDDRVDEATAGGQGGGADRVRGEGAERLPDNRCEEYRCTDRIDPDPNRREVDCERGDGDWRHDRRRGMARRRLGDDRHGGQDPSQGRRRSADEHADRGGR